MLKGGHASTPDAVDVFFDGTISVALRQPRVDTRNTHGTGCTLSAAIAAYLALGRTLQEAVEAAKLFVWAALNSGAAHTIGRGNGPIDHLFGLRSPRDR
jgi:hydroxymethylpyrimidine/phosphomethylpyrimidine kinase